MQFKSRLLTLYFNSHIYEKLSLISYNFCKLCIKKSIYHHKIKTKIPRHNGKVERSYRNDNEIFTTL